MGTNYSFGNTESVTIKKKLRAEMMLFIVMLLGQQMWAQVSACNPFI